MKTPRRAKPTSQDDLLAEFLTKWESVRIGQLAKWQRVHERYKSEGRFMMYHQKKVEHCQHELNMLTELRNRAGL